MKFLVYNKSMVSKDSNSIQSNGSPSDNGSPTLIAFKGLALLNNSDHFAAFLMLIDYETCIVEKVELYFSEFKKSEYESMHIFLPWTVFIKEILKFRKMEAMTKDERIPDTLLFSRTFENIQEKLSELQDNSFLSKIGKIITDSDSKEERTETLYKLFSDKFMKKIVFSVDKLFFDFEISKSETSTESPEEASAREMIKNELPAGENPEDVYYELIPIVDPVTGKTVKKLSNGDIIQVQIKSKKGELEAKISSISPCNDPDKTLIVCELQEGIMGVMKTHTNLKLRYIKNANVETIVNEVKNSLIYIYVFSILIVLCVLLIFFFL